MAWVEIAHAAKATRQLTWNWITVTTNGIDTTGADFIVVVVAHYYLRLTELSDLTDSKGNTWTMLTPGGVDYPVGTIFYCRPTSVGSEHLFTFALGSNVSYPSICVLALSGSAVSPFDQENYGTVSAGTSVNTGSITPTEDGELLIAGLSTYPGSLGSAAAIDQGFTVRDEIAGTGDYMGVALAWKVQPAAAAINPAWSWTDEELGYCVGLIASFKGGAAAPVLGLMPRPQMLGL